MNLAYINVTFTGMEDVPKDFDPYYVSRSINSFQMPYRGYVIIIYLLMWFY
jgi:hypothetical protein